MPKKATKNGVLGEFLLQQLIIYVWGDLLGALDGFKKHGHVHLAFFPLIILLDLGFETWKGMPPVPRQ